MSAIQGQRRKGHRAPRQVDAGRRSARGWILVGLILLAGASLADERAPTLAGAVDHPDRPPTDKARDAGRRPAEVLAFFELAPGQNVVDLMAGAGYYTEILGRAVGADGHVYAHNNAYVAQRFADGPLNERLSRMGLPHVTRLNTELDEPHLPGDLDLAFMALFYHDTYWQEVDRAALNKAVFESLRPGGVYAVIDHHAESGSGARDVERIHRVDAALVRKEIEGAGFVLEAQSDLLRHPADPRTQNVFDAAIRGQTDRFIFKFRKPGAAH